jgi:hypothetical protein
LAANYFKHFKEKLSPPKDIYRPKILPCVAMLIAQRLWNTHLKAETCMKILFSI